MVSRGHNNRGYKMPEAERWGVRREWHHKAHEYRYKTVWHRAQAKLNRWLISTHLTKMTADAMCRVLNHKKLGDGHHEQEGR